MSKRPREPAPANDDDDDGDDPMNVVPANDPGNAAALAAVLANAALPEETLMEILGKYATDEFALHAAATQFSKLGNAMARRVQSVLPSLWARLVVRVGLPPSPRAITSRDEFRAYMVPPVALALTQFLYAACHCPPILRQTVGAMVVPFWAGYNVGIKVAFDIRATHGTHQAPIRVAHGYFWNRVTGLNSVGSSTTEVEGLFPDSVAALIRLPLAFPGNGAAAEPWVTELVRLFGSGLRVTGTVSCDKPGQPMGKYIVRARFAPGSAGSYVLEDTQ